MASNHDYPAKSAWITGLLGTCPRCGSGKLFSGLLSVAPRCDKCGLDYGFVDPGDGPAVFGTLVGGFAVLGAALWTELRYEPPIWVHLVIFLPLTLIVCIGLLRPLKGWLISFQYRNKAEEGRLER